ncbi:MAG TPA: hypothetical protein VG389_19035 [Myxococcota bacterium]|jgi:hypothetical protein|nr:hypothetical protein [Myxococcota bacterium]
METFVAGDLRIEPRDDAPRGVIQLFWSGKSNAANPAQLLGPYFGAVLDEAAGLGRGLEMRFERLGFFNSSTITAVIHAIQNARARGVRLTIVYDPATKAQKLSFEALRGFVKNDELVPVRAA